MMEIVPCSSVQNSEEPPPSSSVTNQGTPRAHTNQLVCILNDQDDILKLNDDSLCVKYVSRVEYQAQMQEIANASHDSFDNDNEVDDCQRSLFNYFDCLNMFTEICESLPSRIRNNNREEVELSSFELLEVDGPVALWFKWEDMWYATIKCGKADSPLPALRATPTDFTRNKYILIFSPDMRKYFWTNMHIVHSIDKFPHPIAYENHEEGLKTVQDLNIARRFIMQKLTLDMLNFVYHFNSNALIEAARDVKFWKQFGMEASHCHRYSDLGKMLQRLKNNIMQQYINGDWILHCSKDWIERCQNAESAESIELLKEELIDSILWNDVNTLQKAPKSDSQWLIWKDDVKKWYATFGSYSKSNKNQQSVSVSNGLNQVSLPVGVKRRKLQVRRAITNALAAEKNSVHENIVDVPVRIETKVPGELFDVPIQIFEGSGTVGRQCQAFVKAKKRQCIRLAGNDDIYCCVHLRRKPEKPEKHVIDDTRLCRGTTVVGTRCKHHSVSGSLFCKKHRNPVEKGETLNINRDELLKRKHGENYSGWKSRINEYLALIRRKDPLQINPVSNIEDESLSARNLSAAADHHNAMENLQLRFSSMSLDENDIKCRICFAKFLDEQTLGNHWMENHKKEAHCLFNGYVCAICFDSFTNKKLLESHFPETHNVQFFEECLLFSCNTCGDHFQEMEKLWLHIMSVHPAELKPSRTPIPEQLTLSTGDNHLKMIEQRNEGSVENRKKIEQRTYLACKICDLKFDSLADLGRHHQAAHIKQRLVRRSSVMRGVRCFPHRMKSGRLSLPNIKRSFEEASIGISRTKRTDVKRRKRERKSLKTCVAELEVADILSNFACSFPQLEEKDRSSPEKLYLSDQNVASPTLSLSNASGHVDDELEQNESSLEKFNLSDQNVVSPTTSLLNASYPVEDEMEQNESSPEKLNLINQNVVSPNALISNASYVVDDELEQNESSLEMVNLSDQNTVSLITSDPTSNELENNKSSVEKLNSSDQNLFSPIALPNNASNLVGNELEKHESSPKELNLTDQNLIAPTSLPLNASDPAGDELEQNDNSPKKLNLSDQNLVYPIALPANTSDLVGDELEQNESLPENLNLSNQNMVSPIALSSNAFESARDELEQNESSHEKLNLGDQNLVSPIPLPSNASDPVGNELEKNESHSVSNSSKKALVLCNDISFGKESIPVICVVDQEILFSLFQQQQYLNISRPWESFIYRTEPIFDISFGVNSEQYLQMKCLCSSSTCCHETCDHVYFFDNDYANAKDSFGEPMRNRFAYDQNGRIILEEGHLVYECNDLCRCNKTCPNRILQNGIRVKLEVFKTDKEGWGVRAGEDIGRGTFVCELIGEVLEEQEAGNRRQRYGKENRNFLFEIDARDDIFVEGQTRFFIDSTRFGNVSRFINQSCLPNLKHYQVLIENTNCKRSHIGLYASRDIALGEELTFMNPKECR